MAWHAVVIFRSSTQTTTSTRRGTRSPVTSPTATRARSTTSTSVGGRRSSSGGRSASTSPTRPSTWSPLPGAQEEYFRSGNPEGKSYRELIGDPIKAPAAFREPAPRLELMDELGVDRTLMFPTLASLLEERMRDDPEMIHAVVHSLNEWIYEEWQFNYEDRIFTTPVISLPIVEKAIEELEWCLERGARCILVRPAPVPGFRGSRSPGYEEFDPVLGAGRRVRRAGGHARLRQRLLPLPERLDGPERDAPVPPRCLPDDGGQVAPDHRHHDGAGLPRHVHPPPRRPHRRRRERWELGRSRSSTSSPTPTC